MNVTEHLSQALDTGRTLFAFELLPPLKGDGLQSVFEAIDPLQEFDPTYINVTFHREGIEKIQRTDGTVEHHLVRRRPGTVGISAAIQQRYGVEVVPHLICGGVSRYDIEDALIDLDFMGIHNVLALRGDSSKSEPEFTPKADGHRYAVELVEQVVAMNSGRFVDAQISGTHRTHFSIGVAGYPECHFEAKSKDADIENLKRKVDAGAEYVVTQMFFDNRHYFNFVERCRAAGITVPIVAGIKPLSTLKQLTVLPEIFNVEIPEALRREALEHSKSVREVGAEWAIAQSRELMAAGIPALHYYTMGRTDNIVKIAKAIF